MKTKRENRPFTHDCSSCVFLGAFEEYDLYWCKKPSHPSLDSVLARYGNDGPEYLSSHPSEAFAGPVEYLWRCYREKSQRWYLEILKRATERGLYNGKYAALCKICECPITANEFRKNKRFCDVDFAAIKMCKESNV